MSRLHIALIHPEIGPNTGNIGRLCLGIGAVLHLIHPLGFDIGEKAVRRAGLDYWKNVKVQEHADIGAFWGWVGERQAHLYSVHGSRSFSTIEHKPSDVLVFGCESVGLPREMRTARGAFCIPMPGPTRSLNLSNAVAVAAYGALQRIEPALFR